MSPECTKKGSMEKEDWVINKMVSAHQEKCPDDKSDNGNNNDNGSNDTSSNQNGNGQRQE